MNGLIMAAQLIAGLAILVTLHEWGHYITARMFGMRVEKFYLFFDAWGFKLFKFKKGDTEYGVGWLPLGGYVKISGMIDESMDKEAMKKPPEPWEFRSKPAWQRLIVMTGGVIMNLILGVLIFTMTLLVYTKKYLPIDEVNKVGIHAYDMAREVGLQTGDKVLEIDGKKFERFKDLMSPSIFFGADLTVERNGSIIHVILPDSLFKEIAGKKGARPLFIGSDNHPFTVDSIYTKDHTSAHKAGILKGDKILAVNSSPISTWGDFREMLHTNTGNTVELTILRNGEEILTNLNIDSTGTIGLQAKHIYEPVSYSFLSALRYGTIDAFENIWINAKGFGKIFSGEVSARESVQGPIGIAKIYGATWEWAKFWSITGLLSMVLAFINILPIPALDGGHVLFLSLEAISGRKFSDKFMERVQIVGMLILLCLMAFAIGNDIINLF